ncbi:MAG: DUF3261 domain-containing protein [Rhodospirillaceae bacterium]|nr:DUF3261 domain-containing protein [Rhodospirillaceae bacterium]
MMPKRRGPRFFWMALLLVAGCAQTEPAAPPPGAWLEPGVRMVLPPAGITPELRRQQLLTGRFGGQVQSLVVMLNADDHQVVLAGLSSVGIRLFLATYDSDGLRLEQSVIVGQLPPPGQVLADIMLSYWPAAAFDPYLPDGWTLRDLDESRELRNPQGEVVTEIRYQKDGDRREPVSIQQNVFAYKIAIQNIGE